MKYFYSHLVKWESLNTKLDELDLDDKEKAHLAKLMEETLYQQVLEAVLDELDEKDREQFVKALQSPDHQEVWQFLDKRVLNIEDKIVQTAEDLSEKLHQDIAEAKELKP